MEEIGNKARTYQINGQLGGKTSNMLEEPEVVRYVAGSGSSYCLRVKGLLVAGYVSVSTN